MWGRGETYICMKYYKWYILVEAGETEDEGCVESNTDDRSPPSHKPTPPLDTPKMIPC